MLKVSGFPELLPEEKIIEEKIFSTIKGNYYKYGYTPIETPAVERNSVLTAKGGGEISKQIFGLYGLANGCDDVKDYSLHFDLTVPFARYVLDYKNFLSFPFKRSQIQKVWRGERAQKGRFREFYQADIDVIWPEGNSSYLFYDAEVIFVLGNTLKGIFSIFNLNENVKIHINHKKIINGFLSSIVKDNLFQELVSIIDKKDKLGEEKFIKYLVDLGLDNKKIEKILNFIGINSLEKIEILNDQMQEGVKELNEILNYLDFLNIKDLVAIDFSIMRGLDYYTGIVFETFIENERALGSIASGGRYENFTKFIDSKSNFSGVGGSIGISRLESYLFDKINKDEKTTTKYLIINFSQTLNESINLYLQLLSNGENVEFYPSPDKLSKQFKYADRKGIPYVIILGEDELKEGVYQVKNMKTGEKLLQKIKK